MPAVVKKGKRIRRDDAAASGCNRPSTDGPVPVAGKHIHAYGEFTDRQVVRNQQK